MKTKKILGVKIFGLVALLLLLAVNCAKDGTAPQANIPPNTFITNFQIALAPDSATYYNTTISWSGSDADGAVFWYYWSIIESDGDSLFGYNYDIGLDGNVVSIDTVNLSLWQPTNTLNLTMHLDFSTFDKSYIFRVKSEDNDRVEDPTPAEELVAIDRIRESNFAPNTEIVEGPTNGATTGSGIHFVIQGTDVDGIVDTIQYSIDGGSWVVVPTDIVTGTLTYNLLGLTNGAHTITFQAIDNFREVDPSPVSVSVVVDNTLAPELAISVRDGQSFLVPFTEPIIDEITVSITATVDFYYSAIDSFRITSSDGDEVITTEASYTFENLSSGDYWVEVTAYDIGGNSTSTGHVDFSIIELPAGDGVLCINGVDWGTYEAENAAQWNAGTPWGNRTNYKIWDVFDSAPLGSLNANFTDSLLGTGSVPTWMFDTTFFDAISWFANVFSSDEEFWLERDSNIMAYLEMGGNVYLPSRRAHFLFFDELTAYTHVASWVEDGDLPSGLTAVYEGLDDIARIGGQSFSSVPTLSSSSEVTTLYTSAEYPGANPGFIVMPNGAEGGGKFCFIAGRNYRWNHTQLKATTEYVLHDFFGIGQ